MSDKLNGNCKNCNNHEKQQDYLKFKTFADDLRQAESWCKLDGVLNRYQTVKNLSKMGYHKQSEDCEKRIANQREEISRLHERINDLTQSRDVWKKQAERVGKQLNEVLSKQSKPFSCGHEKGEWIFEHEYYGKMLCSNCNGEALVNECSEYVDSDFCPNCGEKMKG